MLMRRMETQARETALAGDTEKSARRAELVVQLREKLNTAAAYNLDKRQTALSMVDVYCSA
jgi:DNA polymerase-3 subunit delta'